jgi:hypothetical protein
MTKVEKVEVVHIPSLDDMGDWYVFVDGKQRGYSFWGEENARAADDYLWRGMPIG